MAQIGATPVPMVIFLVLGFIFVMIFGLVVVTTLISSGSEAKPELSSIADSLNGQISGNPRRRLISFRAGGHSMRLTISPNHHGMHKFRLSVPWEDSQLRIRIFPEEVPEALKKFLGMQDIQIGNPEFDPAFIVQCNHVNELTRILTPNVQREMLRIGTEINLTITGGTLSIEFVRNLNERFFTQEVIQRCVDLVSELIQAGYATSGVELVFIENETSTCMVCGEPVSEPRVSCRSCNTPHHRDCWEYLGMCSTYACGSKRAR